MQDQLYGLRIQTELEEGEGVVLDPRDAGPVGAKDHLPGQPLEVVLFVVLGQLLWWKAGDLDPHVLSHGGHEGRGVVPPSAPPVSQNYREVGKVPDHVFEEGRVRVTVGGTWERAGAAVDYHRQLTLLAEPVGWVKGRVVRHEASVYRVQLQGDRAHLHLALQLRRQGIMVVGVEVGHEFEAFGVVLGDGREVFDGLDPGRLWAVLAQEDSYVYPFPGHVLVEAGPATVGPVVAGVAEGEDVPPAG